MIPATLIPLLHSAWTVRLCLCTDGADFDVIL